jgi:hypothetical protein
MNQKTQTSARVQNLGSFVWSIAEIDFKQSEYGKVILPFVVMRRLDCILDSTKPAVLEAEKSLPEGIDDETRDMILFGAAGDNIRVYNTSRFTFASLKGQDRSTPPTGSGSKAWCATRCSASSWRMTKAARRSFASSSRATCAFIASSPRW